MSLAIALNTSLSGLNASATQTETISNNVANALTPGYAAQTTELSTVAVNGTGQGVRVTGISSAADPVTTATRRTSDAELGYATVSQEAQTQLSIAIGTADYDGSLADHATGFEAALVASSNDPASTQLQNNLAEAADSYADAINSAASDVQEVREQADADIDRMVDEMNVILEEIEDLNIKIQQATAAGLQTATLVNQRDQQLDSLASYVPITLYPREDGAVAVYTSGGGLLLDGEAVELAFEPTPTITADMTLAGGTLNTVTANGQPIDIGSSTGVDQYGGGALSAAFDVRDVMAPAASDTLDALAEDLILRFEDPTVDTTLASGDPGLFTDNQGAYDATDTIGLAGRIELNDAVNPDEGGEVWRLRDGINAGAQGDVGSSTILDNLLTAATEPVAPPASTGIPTAVSATGFAIELSNQLASAQLNADSDVSFHTAYNAELRQAETSIIGVNIDAELQKLVLIEQAYAANAQVITVIDELYSVLLSI